jgi:ABC-type polysaccharide/polyol phosphate export permease
LNPLYYFITATREIVIYQKIPEISLLFAMAISSALVFFMGLFVFEKFKNRLAEKL